MVSSEGPSRRRRGARLGSDDLAGADTAGIHRPPTHKAPQHAYRTFQADWANECWQLDDIDWELEDGSPVKIITVIDDCTRLCPGLKAAPSANGAAFEAMTAAATRWEWPQRFLSDNAKAYKHTLAAAVGTLGVDHRHGRSYHPQTHGKVERFHQTRCRLRRHPQHRTSRQTHRHPHTHTVTGCPATPHCGFRVLEPWVADGGMRSLEPSVPNRLLSAKESLIPARVGIFTKVLLMY